MIMQIRFFNPGKSYLAHKDEVDSEIQFASPIIQDIVNICQAQGIPLIEDACQALGAVQKGKKAGSYGLVGCFSFYPAKILGAYGDAGALVTNDGALAEEVRELRTHYKK